MSETPPKSTPETSSEDFFGGAEGVAAREAERNADAYRTRLMDEAIAGIDDYLAENPGVTREEAHAQIAADLAAYDAKLRGMHEAGDEYGTLDHTIDATDAGERLDGIDRTIAADPALRRMNMMATHIAELRAESTDTNADIIKDKEDKLNELLAEYEAAGGDAEVMGRIVDNSVETAEIIKKPAVKMGEHAVKVTSGPKIPRTSEVAPEITLGGKKAEATPAESDPAAGTGRKPEVDPEKPKTGIDAWEEDKRTEAIESIAEQINAAYEALDEDDPNFGIKKRAMQRKIARAIEQKYGLSMVEAGKLLDRAWERSNELETDDEDGSETAPTAPEVGPVDDSAEGDSSEAVDDHEIDKHKRMRDELEAAGALTVSSPRKRRKAIRKLRKKNARQFASNKAEKMGKDGYDRIDYMNAYEDLYKDYFKKKGVKNSLMNRMRYRFGYEPK